MGTKSYVVTGKGKTVFRTESGPLKEVLDRIEERANYGDTASGGGRSDAHGQVTRKRLKLVSEIRKYQYRETHQRAANLNLAPGWRRCPENGGGQPRLLSLRALLGVERYHAP